MLTGQEISQKVVEKFALDERRRKKTEASEELREVIRRSLLKVITSPIRIVKNLLGAEERPPNFFAQAVRELMEEAQDIELEANTNVINLSIWEETPALASDIANHMTHLLIEKSTQLDQTNAAKAYGFTREQMESAEQSLKETEQELLRFRKNNNIVSLEEQKKAKLDELHDVENQLLNTRTAFSEAQAKLEELRRKISVQKTLLTDSPIFANNPVIRELMSELNRAEIELAGELEKFTESSERVRTLKAQTSEARASIDKELMAITQSDTSILASVHPDLSKEYARLTTDVPALAARIDTLKKEIDALRAEAFSLSVLETELQVLERRRDTNEELYKKLLDKYSEFRVQQASQMSGYDLKIIDKALVPEDIGPDSPKWILVIPSAFIGSLLLSLVAVFFLEYWNEAFNSPGDLEDKTGLPVLCTVPDMKR
jgi:uncharacterized protein involved in exopolysaccharide biosynthesis